MAKNQKKQRYKEIRNARARRDYFIEETLEAGIILRGTEVKAIRSGQVQINDSFIRIDQGVPILYHAHIAEYRFGSDANHKAHRPRKLLMNDREIRAWEQSTQSGGRTIIPLRMYFKQALVKVEVALAKGKKHYDKRDDIKKKVELREAQRSVKHHL